MTGVRANWRLAAALGGGLLAVVTALVLCSARPNAEEPAGGDELIVFHAGSLSVPFRELSALFASRRPGLRVKAEAAGSVDCARKITELGRPCDVFASADYRIVEDLLMPLHAAFDIRFASNQIGIAYTQSSRVASQINSENWHEVLLRPEVTFGRADPDSDPCGYRTMMVFQLAERHYGVTGLAPLLEAKHGARFLRPKETDLLALLEAGEIDYLFIYRSVARQHGLQFISLPDEVNLGSVHMAGLYESARVWVQGGAPGESATRVGEAIVYSVTIPRNAPHQGLAEDYVALLLSSEGQEVMRRNGQDPIVPFRVAGRDSVPARLKALCE